MYSERQKISYKFDDESGISPLDVPAVLTFELDIDTEAGDEFCDRTLTINSIRLVEIETDEGTRPATESEAVEVGGWFWVWIESRPGWGEQEAIENSVFGEP